MVQPGIVGHHHIQLSLAIREFSVAWEDSAHRAVFQEVKLFFISLAGAVVVPKPLLPLVKFVDYPL